MAEETPQTTPAPQGKKPMSTGKKALIAGGACTGCCLVPFVIGLVIGIATITSLCDLYHKYWSNPWATLGRYAASPLGSYIADRSMKKIINQYCGSTIGSSYSLIPCGDFGELVEKYVGKYGTEMKGLMDSAGVRFDPGAWCADFTAFIVKQLGYDIDDFWYPHTNNWINKFKSGEDGWRLLSEGETPQPGDIAMKRNGAHTCMVYQIIDSNHFYCFGGNQGGTYGNRMVTKDSRRITSEFYFGRLPGR